MNNSKKPSEPVEEERWVKIEKEVQELKRSRSILSIGLFLLSGLYGILILCIILRIIRIEDTLTSIIQFNALVGEHLQSLGDSLIRILNDFEMLLRALSEVFLPFCFLSLYFEHFLLIFCRCRP